MNIIYFGYVGDFGYAIVAQNIINALKRAGYSPIFKILNHYHVNDETTDSNLSINERYLTDGLPDETYHPDIIIFHAFPYDLSYIFQKVKDYWPRALYVSITTWETDRLPVEWIPQLNKFDTVFVPCQFNQDVFSKDLDIPVEVVHHSIVRLPEPDLKFKIPAKTLDYIFYNINSFDNRKGIKELLTVYFKTFFKHESVFLYIKTGGETSPHEAHLIIEKIITKHHLNREILPRYYLEFSLMNKNQISSIHNQCHCFVSLSKGEGTGLSLCDAGLLDKPIIALKYGGQIDYIPEAYWVEHQLESATLCNSVHENWEQCEEKGFCVRYPFFNAKYQNWAKPHLLHASKIMRKVYQKRLHSGIKWRDVSGKECLVSEFVRKNFNLEKIGNEFKKHLEKLKASKKDF